MQVQPMEMQPPVYGQPVGAPNSNNAVMNLVSNRFGLIPRVIPAGRCCHQPMLPHGMHIVPVVDINSPAQVTQVASQVINQQQPTPLSSHIPQDGCCPYMNFNRIFSSQEFKDPQGRVVFSFVEEVNCCRPPVLNARDGDNKEIGHLEWGGMTCGDACATWCCLFFCRTATTSEYAWLKAVGPDGQERLTFRHPAKVGQCMLCMWSRVHTQQGCCYTPPDVPFVERNDVYGPMPQPGTLGTVEVRGAYGYDVDCCGIRKLFGPRPEMVTSLNLSPNLSFEDTVLATQMATQRSEAAVTWVTPDGRVFMPEWRKPAAQAMHA